MKCFKHFWKHFVDNLKCSQQFFFPTIETSEVCRSHWMWLLYPVYPVISFLDLFRTNFHLFHCQVCGIVYILRLSAEQFGAVGEEPVVCDRCWQRASGQTSPWGRTVLLHPLWLQWLPDSAYQLPRRGCMWVIVSEMHWENFQFISFSATLAE